MPRRLLSMLPRQSNRVGHPPPLVERGGRGGRTISSPGHGQGTGEMESSKMSRLKSRKMRKTNIVPLPGAPDVVGASTDTERYTP
jgi:hypothetical protein